MAQFVQQLRDCQTVAKAEKLRRSDRQKQTRIEKKRTAREQRECIKQLELRCTERINTYEEATDQEMEDTAMTDLGVTKSKSDGVNFTTE